MTCINTTWYKDSNGYGRKIINKKLHLAHRVAWEAVNGIIPNGFVIRHTCDNPSCINPEHLVLGTQLDNIKDRDTRKRTAVGLSNGRAKVTPEMVATILSSSMSSRKLGQQLGVAHRTVLDVRQGNTYLSRIALGSAPVPNTVGSEVDSQNK